MVLKKMLSFLIAVSIIATSFANVVMATDELDFITADWVTEAVLYDNAGEKTELCTDYDVIASQVGNAIKVSIITTDLKKHTNDDAECEEGYWTGFAVTMPDGAEKVSYVFEDSNSDGAKSIDGIVIDGKISFYVNAGDKLPKTSAKLQWFDGEGNPLTKETEFIIDLLDVTLDYENEYEYIPVEANVKDSENQEREVYTYYDVDYSTAEDGTILVDIDMTGLEYHKNGYSEPEYGFWTGFAVAAPDGAVNMKYTFGDNAAAYCPIETAVANGNDGVAFYTDAAEPVSDAKLQWFDGNDNALSNPVKFTINFDDIEYYRVDAENDITEAILKDNSAEPVTALFSEGTYNVDAKLCEGVINVSIAAENVVKHKNENCEEGYWVGFAVKAPDATVTSANINFGGAIYLNEPVSVIDGNDTKGIAFYINAGDAHPKTDATLQWLDENGEILCEETNFNIDLSDISLAIDYTPVIDKAKVADNAQPEKEIYDAYEVTSSLKTDGTILVDISMTELTTHKRNNNELGYWTGFAVEAPDGANCMKYAFGTSKDLALGDLEAFEENVIDTKSGIAFYADMADAEPKKYAKLQWYNGTEAVSNVITFEMNLDNVKLNWIKADKVSAATPRSGEVTPQIAATQNEDIITVALTAEDVNKHLNEDTAPKDGYWVGFAVEAPQNDAKADVSFGGVSYGILPLEDIAESKKGIAFYTDAGVLEPKTEATLQWLAADGVTPLCAPTKFVIDISGVTLASLPYITAEKVEKANVVDRANTSVQPYGTYSATASLDENGVIVIDIDMTDLKEHKNGENKTGLWTGFSVTAPDDAVSIRYAFSETREGLSSMQVAELDGETQVSFYANIADAEPKKFVRLQWFDENGIAITNATDFEMDLSGVSLYVEAINPTRGGSAGSSSYYTVSFDANGGSSVSSVKVKKDGTVSSPAAPVKDGFVFEGWYTDKELVQKYDFSAVVTKSFTLYAKWKETEADTGMKFTDVKKDAWYYNVIKTAVQKGLMNGISETEFVPEKEVTRGMFVTILYRAAGEPQTEANTSFTDVSADAYYAKAVAWASANGIVNGITDELFAPNENITREQMAVILYRYKKAEKTDKKTTYTDENLISEYALDAINWANAQGIMTGNEDGSFAPLRNSSRAEAAAVFVRLLY